jgi:DNA-binding transcriptional LysR family regulator
MNLSLREIEYVLTVASEENITRASEKLYIAQPSLSQAIKKIEDEVGFPLFTRVKNKIKLTQEGKIFVEAGLQIGNTIRNLENRLHEFSQLDYGRLTLGLPYQLGAFVIPKALSTFKRMFPSVDVELYENTSSELENLVITGTVDIAIMPLPITNPSIAYQPFLTGRMVLIMEKSNPLNDFAYDKGLGEKHLYFDVKRAADEVFILGNRGQRIRSINELIFKKNGISPRIVLYSKNIETIKNLAAAGIGLAIVPEQYMKRDDEYPSANIYYLEEEQGFTWTIAAAFFRSSYRSPASQQFLKVLEDSFSPEETPTSTK